MSLPVS